MDLGLKGKRALVSGSTAGIGYAIAATLAREGASVIVNGRTQAAVDAAILKLQADTGGSVHGFAGDLSTGTAAEEVAGWDINTIVPIFSKVANPSAATIA